MTELKCPVCGKQMKLGTLDLDDGMGTVWMSIMPCDCVCSYGASKAVWQVLIDTKKKLDVAVDALKRLSLGNIPSLPDDETLALAMCNYARDTLKQIKDKE